MKTCKDCGVEKPHSEFYTYKRGEQVTLYARCKPCHCKWKDDRTTNDDRRRHRRAHRATRIAMLNELKTDPCIDCRVSYPPHVMDFDHLEDTDKFSSLAKMVGRYSWDRILAEVAKCELVCSNCHRERTWQRRQT